MMGGAEMLRIKKAIPSLVVSSLFFIVFNVLSFVLAEHLNANFWCGYIFVTLAWLCLMAMSVCSCRKKYEDKSLFLNAPSLLVSVCHLVVQTVIGTIVMAFSSLSVKASVCFQVIIFAIYIAIVVLLKVYKEANIR